MSRSRVTRAAGWRYHPPDDVDQQAAAMLPVTRCAWLKGPQTPCDVPPAGATRLNLVLLGPPGVGKGTQAEILSARLGPCHLSTGDVFRVANFLDPSERTPALNEALDTIARGGLATDAVALNLVRERAGCLRCRGGFLLDGFPRSVPQAIALADLLAAEGVLLDAVVLYDLPLDRVITRLAGRRVCGRCTRVYHVEANPPRVAGICTACAGVLEKRDDDRPEVVRIRMRHYHASTEPLIAFYDRLGLLLTVDAAGTPEQVFARTAAFVGQPASTRTP